MPNSYPVGKVKGYTLAAIAFSLIISIVSYLLLGAHTSAFRFTVAISVATSLFSLAAIPLFLNGLHNFKAGLRRAYITLCVGIGIFGLAQLQIPLINIFNGQAWLNSGGAAAVYLVSTVPMLLGVRRFARLLTIKSRWGSIWLCALASVLLGFAVSRLPHVKVTTAEAQYDLFLGIIIWDMMFVTFSGMLVLKIRSMLTDTYRKPIAWLAAAFLVLAAAGVHFAIVHLTLTDGDPYFDYSASIIPFGLGALLFIKAGYEFTVLSAELSEETAASPARKAAPASTQPNVTSLDVVVYTASLASNHFDIEPIMDDVRMLTSTLDPDQVLTPAQTKTLAEVYHNLVGYLTQKEPLRVYTETEITHNLGSHFGEKVFNDIPFLHNS